MAVNQPDRVRVLILVADDRRRHRVRAALERDGHAVSATQSGRHAAALLADAERCPDVIVLDMHLSGEDGIAFASAYRRAPAPHPPLVLVPSGDQAVPARLLPEDDPSVELVDPNDDSLSDAALAVLRARVRLQGREMQERRLAERKSRLTGSIAAAGVAAALLMGALASAPVLAWSP